MIESVNSSEPCRGCGNIDWCFRTSDGWHHCHRGGGDGWVEHRGAKGNVTWIWHESALAPPPKPSPDNYRVSLAPIELRHEVYSHVVKLLEENGCRLLVEHEKALLARGMDSPRVRLCGFFSFPSQHLAQEIVDTLGHPKDRLLGVPGFLRGDRVAYVQLRDHAGALGIPVRDASGQIGAVRLRVEGEDEKKKYLWLSAPRLSNVLGCSPGAMCHVPLHSRELRTGVVRVTEGEIKAEIATERTNTLTISVPGVGLWPTAIEALRELKASRVLVAYDADQRRNPAVARALQSFASALHSEGFEVVVEVWPEELGKGIDDVLVNPDGGPWVIELREGREAWEHIANVTAASGARVDPCVQARADLTDIVSRAKKKPGVLVTETVLRAFAVLYIHARPEFVNLEQEIRRARLPLTEWKKALRPLIRSAEEEQEQQAESRRALVSVTEMWRLALHRVGMLGDEIREGVWEVTCPRDGAHNCTLQTAHDQDGDTGHPRCADCSLSFFGWVEAVGRTALEEAAVEAFGYLGACDGYVMTSDGIFSSSMQLLGAHAKMSSHELAQCPRIPGRGSEQYTRFPAKITAEHLLVRDGEGEPEREFEIQATIDGEERTVRVSAEKFGTFGWVHEQFGARAILTSVKNAKVHACEAMQMMSRPVRHTIHCFTGWHRIEGSFLYLHAGGAIGKDGPVEGVRVQIQAPLDMYSLPSPPEDPKTFVRAAYELLSAGPDVVLLVGAATWRAVLGSCSTTMMLAAEPKLGKTTLACIFASHFGVGLLKKVASHLKVDTGASINFDRARIGDALFVIDDYLLTGDRHPDATMNNKVELIVRAQHSGAGAKRLQRDAKATRNELPPRSQPLITGEMPPPGHSLLSRILTIEFGERLAIPISELERRAGLGVYARAMAAYIQWLAPKIEAVRKSAPARAAALAAEVGGDSRTAAMLGEMRFGIEGFVKFATEIQAITEEEGAHLREKTHVAVSKLAVAQGALVHEQDLTVRFFEMVSGGLASGACHFTDRNGRAPTNSYLYGWQDDGNNGRRPTGKCIGIVDGENAWIHAESVILALRSIGPFPLTARQLSKRLFDKKLLAHSETTQDTYTTRCVVGGQQRRGYLHVRLSDLGVDSVASVPPATSQDSADVSF